VGAKDDEKIKRLFPQLVDGDLFFIRQWYDSIYWTWPWKSQKPKTNFVSFKQLFDLKVHCHKSELLCFGEDQDEASLYAKLFGHDLDQFTISYLDILVHFLEAQQCWMETCWG
jgi:hypothetical protein